MADYRDTNNADLREPLDCHPGHEHFPFLKYEPSPQMQPACRMSEEEYTARKPDYATVTATAEGFAMDTAPRFVFTTGEQVTMNIQAQTLILGDLSNHHKSVSNGGSGIKDISQLNEAHCSAINLVASAATGRYPLLAAKEEVLRHNAIVDIQRLIRKAKELAIEPYGPENDAARNTRLHLKEAIEANIERRIGDWEGYLKEYKKDVGSGLEPPVNNGNFGRIPPTFLPKLKRRQLRRADALIATLWRLRESANTAITTNVELTRFPRGRLYDYFTTAERIEFWHLRYDVYKYHYFAGFKGFLDLTANFDDAIMGPWMEHIFCTVMDSLWVNHVGPEMQKNTIMHDFVEQDIRAQFERRVNTHNSSTDFRGIGNSYSGTRPTLDNMLVFQGVLETRKKPIPLRTRAVNGELPFVAPGIYDAE